MGDNDGAPCLAHLPPTDAVCKLMLLQYASQAPCPPAVVEAQIANLAQQINRFDDPNSL